MKLIKRILLLHSVVCISGSVSDNTGTYTCASEHRLNLKSEQRVNVTSPGFLDFHYPVNSLCSWTIESGPKTRLLVEFVLISIWPSFNCILDGLILFDGNSSLDPIIGRYCSGTPSYPFIETSGPAIHIVFYSSDFAQRQFRGFFLSVEELEPEVPCEEDEIACHNKKCVDKNRTCDEVDDCGDGTDEESCGLRTPRFAVSCGSPPIKPILDGGDSIVGGRSAVPGSWPWQCSLRKKGGPFHVHLCGAVLVNNRWILTVAHCFRQHRNASHWSVHLGKYFKEKTDSTEQVRYIKHLYIHPRYKFERSNHVLVESKEWDIAFAELNAPVTMTKFVHPVCLPPWRADVEAGTLSYVTGWGETLGTGDYDVLKQAAVPITSKESCSKSYEKWMNITDNMICAGYATGGHDSCKGDSGGPLVIMRRNHWYLIGLVSTGYSCAAPMQPGIYTSVSYFKTWISDVLRMHNDATIGI